MADYRELVRAIHALVACAEGIVKNVIRESRRIFDDEETDLLAFDHRVFQLAQAYGLSDHLVAPEELRQGPLRWTRTGLYYSDGRLPQFYGHWRKEMIKLRTIAEKLAGTMVEKPADSDSGKSSVDYAKQTQGNDEGYLGLTVDSESRTVSRVIPEIGKRHTTLNSEILWHTFKVFFAAKENNASVEQWKSGYPGEWSARFQATSSLRDRIESLGVTVKARGRCIVELE